MEKPWGKILFIDDEPFEADLMKRALKKIGLEDFFLYFQKAHDALEFLQKKEEPVFMIFCDMNMPKMNGMEFKKQINSLPQLRNKTIPFIFYSSSFNEKEVEEAFENHVQGYFPKPSEQSELVNLIKSVVDYWSRCRYPNNA